MTSPLITSGPDGALWFTNVSTIGRITTTGVVSTYTGTGISQAAGITRGPDGALWFANYGNSSIGRITTAGVVTNYTGTGINVPTAITAGPDGALWFTNHYGDSIGRITTGGAVSNYPVGGNAYPDGIATGSEGALWFTDPNNSSIYRMTTGGNVTAKYLDAGTDASSMTAGPDGALWFANYIGNSIGRITTAGAISNFTGVGVSVPSSITAGPDGALWFTNNGNCSIGRVTTAGVVSNYPISGTPPPPPPDDSGGGAPAATCTNHVVPVGPVTIYASCFKRTGNVLTATGRVRMSGVDIDPGATGMVTIDLKALTVKASGQISVSLGRFRVFHKSGSWQLDLKKKLTFDVSADAKVKGLPLSGKLELAPGPPDAIDVTAKAGIGFLHLTGDVMLHLSNQTGLSINKLDVMVGDIPLGPLASIKGGSLAYSRTSDGHDKWSAMVTVKLPPHFPDMKGMLEIRDGELSDTAVTASNINQIIGEVVYLQSLGLDVRLVPNLKVTGMIGLSAGPTLPIINQPAVSLNTTLSVDFANPVVFEAMGDLTVFGKIDLAQADLKWTIPSELAVSGNAKISIGPASISAAGRGRLNHDGFGFQGFGDLSLPGVHAQGFGYISEKGVTGCAEASAGPTNVLAGFGYHWGDSPLSVDLWFDSCGAMDYQSSVGYIAAVAPHVITFKVPRGQSQTLIGARGSNGYPSFMLRSPSGQIIDPSHGLSGAVDAGGYRYVFDPNRHGTYVILGKPTPGTWTLLPLAASVPAVSTGEALSAPPAKVHTRVRRHGRSEILTWRARPIPGQSLEFNETTSLFSHTIIKTSKARGTIKFTPLDDGRGDVRQVQIVVNENNLPRAFLTGARFTAPLPPRPPAPRHLRWRHHRHTLTLTWAPERADRYDIHITTSDGRRLYFQQLAGQTKLTIHDAFPPVTVTATIRAVAADGLDSHPATTKLHLTK